MTTNTRRVAFWITVLVGTLTACVGATTRQLRQNTGVTFKVLHHFTGGTSDGGIPVSKLIRDTKGNLYGMVTDGGAYGYGAVYKLSLHNGRYSFNLLHSFNYGDGSSPFLNEMILRKDTLYGETPYGGSDACTYGCGIIFSIDTKGERFSVLHRFSGSDGAYPYGGLLMDNNGMYGTTSQGGTHDYGTVFRFSDGTLTTIVGLDYSNTGAYPYAGLNVDESGNLWGTTSGGGSGGGNCYKGCGAIFRLTPTVGSGWHFTLVHAFSGPDGAYPQSRVVFGKAGSVFGTTLNGGSKGAGVVYGLRKSDSYKEMVIYNFCTQPNCIDGGVPSDQLRFNHAGHVFGTTYYGGERDWGTVFELTHTSGSWHENVLHSFTGSDGCNPWSGVILDKKGYLFGTAPYCANGAVFEISGIQ